MDFKIRIMKRNNFKGLNVLCLLALLGSLAACTDYLDVKPDKALVVPNNARDLQGLLDYTSRMNSSYPGIQEAATDNVFLQPATWQNLADITAKNIYVWNDDVFNNNELNEWSLPYVTVFYANTVLDQLAKIVAPEQEKRRMRAEALFYRSFAFYQLAQLFAAPYEETTASQTLGIPLRTTADISANFSRASLRETYDRVIMDLKTASAALPVQTEFKTTPSKPATLGLLARVYLAMERYQEAELYADSCLNYQSTLLDFKQLNLNATYPFARYNPEVIFHSTTFGRTVLSVTFSRVSPELYAQYQNGDLRRTGFFMNRAGLFSFKGSYDGTASLFNGIAVNEMLLISAESAVRRGDTVKALERLHQLLRNRWTVAAYQKLESNQVQQVLDWVLQERRKELLFRGLRWTDLRRLNKDPRYAKDIIRDINGEEYVLKANSNQYVLPIPIAVVNGGIIVQNPR